MTGRKQAPLTEPIRQFLINCVSKSGTVPELLPCEMALTERFQVSRPTVRIAIESLLESGHVHRIAGRRGLFTNPEFARNSLCSIAVTGGIGHNDIGDQSLIAVSAGFIDEICYHTSHLSFINFAWQENGNPAEDLRKRGFDSLLWLGPDSRCIELADKLIADDFPVVVVPSAYNIPEKLPCSNAVYRAFFQAGRRRVARLMQLGYRHIAFVASVNEAYDGILAEYAARGVNFPRQRLLSDTGHLAVALARLLDEDSDIDCISSDGGAERYEQLFPLLQSHPRGKNINVHISYGAVEKNYQQQYPDLKIHLNPRNYSHATFRTIGRRAAQHMIAMLKNKLAVFPSEKID